MIWDYLAWAIVWSLCFGGIILSCLALSGTWLLVIATIIAAYITGSEFPGLWTVIAYIAIAGLVEVADFFAGTWGVKSRGGTAKTGFAALIGGVLGLIFGSTIPIPIIGNLIGMLIGSFALAFVVERNRQKDSIDAVYIAWGAVIGRLLILFLKVGTTLGMSAYLFIRIIF